MSPAVATTVLWLAAIVGQAGLLGRLAQLGLLRTHPAFALYLAVFVGGSLWLLTLDPSSSEYIRAWFYLEWLSLCLQILMAVEIWRLYARHYSSLGSFGVKVVAVIATAAVILTVLSFAVEHDTLWMFFDRHSVRALMVLRRYTAMALAIALGLVFLFFREIRVPAIPRNLVRHNVIAMWHLAGIAAAWMAINASRGHFRDWATLFQTAWVAATTFAWIWGFRASGLSGEKSKPLTLEAKEALLRDHAQLEETLRSKLRDLDRKE